MTELCEILSYYSLVPMLHVDIVTNEVTAAIRYVIGKGYTIASTNGVIEADSYNQMIHLFKLEFCSDDFVEPLTEMVMR